MTQKPKSITEYVTAVGISLSTMVAGIILAAALPGTGRATPSTTFWAPSTPFVQPFGVLHVTYDTYFGSKAAYPIDVGLTMGVLPWKGLQLRSA